MNVLEQLKTDHENLATLLDILEDQISRIHAKENADLGLIRDIMHYMTTYPDGFHHPMEDVVLEKLIDREPGYRETALALVKEHNALANKSSAFLGMVNKIIHGEVVLRKDIVARGSDYVDFLRSHMRREEEHFFPRAEAVLSDSDWTQIRDKIKLQRDPVFGQIVDAQYRSISQFISLQSDS